MTVDPDKFINERAAKRPIKSGNSGRRGDYGVDEPPDSPEWRQKDDLGRQGDGRDNRSGTVETVEKVESVEPVDLWDDFEPPELPVGLLPRIIEKHARSQGRLMGADPGGLAMADLCTAAALTDVIKLQPHRHNPGWLESARIRVAVVGGVSDKKSPMIGAATAPLAEIDAELFRAFCEAMDTYERLTKEEKRSGPPPPRAHSAQRHVRRGGRRGACREPGGVDGLPRRTGGLVRVDGALREQQE